jgi:hypothetical protein
MEPLGLFGLGDIKNCRFIMKIVLASEVQRQTIYFSQIAILLWFYGAQNKGKRNITSRV